MTPSRAGVLLVAFAGCVSSTVPHVPISCELPCGAVVEEVAAMWETVLAADPGDRNLVAGMTMDLSYDEDEITRVKHVAQSSRDGGRTWTYWILPSGTEAPRGHPLHLATRVADPALVFLPSGAVLHAGMAMREVWYGGFAPTATFASDGIDLYTARSTDGGATYDDFRIVAKGVGAGAGPLVAFAYVLATSAEAPSLAAAEDGTTLLVWADLRAHTGRAPERPILAATSTDEGLTWTDPVATGADGIASGAVALPGGRFVVGAHQTLPGPDSLDVLISDDSGRTWRTVTVAETLSTGALRKVPGSEQSLVMVHTRPDGDGMVLALVRSDDGGETWRSRVLDRLDEPFRVRRAVDVAADGTVFVGYLRPTGRDGPVEHHVLAIAEDGIDRVVVDADTGPRDQIRGDFTGIAAVEDGAVVAWPGRDEGAGSPLLVARVVR